MPNSSWRKRVADEKRRQKDLQDELRASAIRRAQALLDGVAELGSQAAVAREIGVSTTAVQNAIKDYGTATAPPAKSTTEDQNK
ncbi:hypothetical protein [Streptomyces anulatus]|uniref:hypothetical protein n=1 Tax=Streptomyces anulatus TaxID=1892 RepID=UPI003867D35C|nr:hypothetical protein OG238_11840 [Streptomyces anulatus]